MNKYLLLCYSLILFHNLNWHSYTTPAYCLSKYGDPAALPAQGSGPKVLLFFHSSGQRGKKDRNYQNLIYYKEDAN